MAAPAAPTNLSLTAGDGTIAMAWDNPNDASITGYRYALGSGGVIADILGSDATTVAHTITGVANGQDYTVSLWAVNNDGSSERADATVSLPYVWGPDSYMAALDGFAAERDKLKAAKQTVVNAKQAVVDAEAAVTAAQAALETAQNAVGPAEDAVQTQKAEAVEAAQSLHDLLATFING